MKTNPTPKSLDSLIEQYNRELMHYVQQHADRIPPDEEAKAVPAHRKEEPRRPPDAAASPYAGRTVDDLLTHEFPLPSPYPEEEPPAPKRFSYTPPPTMPEEEDAPPPEMMFEPLETAEERPREQTAEEAPEETPPLGMSTGYLQVQVTSAREATPVPGALVTVTRMTDGGEELYAHTVTDTDGLTDVFPLPAVDSALTLEPGIPSPYTGYNIQANAPGFYRVFNVNAPVYGGNTAIQPVQMIPIPEFEQSPPDLVFFQTGPQDL